MVKRKTKITQNENQVKAHQPALEDKVWQVLKTCFDPEIPVNIVDLGLIYGVTIELLEDGNYRVKIAMTLTSPACSMGPMIAEDARQKVLSLPEVSIVDIDFVFDPPWDKSRISEAAQLELGLL